MSSNQLDRRQMLAMGLGAGAASLPFAASGQVSPSAKAPAINHNLPDVVVVGAGAFGGWAALSLRERGAKVTLVDAYGPGNPRASSGGENRNISAAYGDREVYTRWAHTAWAAWHRRQEEFGRRLIYPSGGLRILPRKVMAADIATFDRLKLPYELLTGTEVSRRWPQIRYEEAEMAFYDRNAGTVKARDSMIAVSEVFMQKGGVVQLGYAKPGRSAGGRLETITVDGTPVSAGAFVFACGPWLPKLLPTLLGDRITAPRRELFFIGTAPGDTRYRWENIPYLADGILSTSSDIGGGYKLAPNLLGVPIDPDDGDRLPTPFLIDQVNAFLARHLPGLVGRPVIQSYVCQLERTDNDHFLIDRHPDYANAWIAGGGSGHAFKMGPVLGEYIADRALGIPQAPEYQALFGLAAHKAVTAGQGA